MSPESSTNSAIRMTNKETNLPSSFRIGGLNRLIHVFAPRLSDDLTRLTLRAELWVGVALGKSGGLQEKMNRSLQGDRGDVPGWVLVVLMTTGLITGIWTVAAPRLSAILTHSLDSMNNIR